VYSSLGVSVLHLLESYSSMHIMVATRSYLHGLMCMVKEKFKFSVRVQFHQVGSKNLFSL
jgi:hypothetical protein